MNNRYRCALAFLLLLATQRGAKADWIAWTYAWSSAPSIIHADNVAGGGYIALSDETLKQATGSSDIIATNLQTYSKATAANPDTFTSRPYVLNLTLTDVASGKVGNAVFTGVFNGSMTADSSNITNQFTGAWIGIGDPPRKALPPSFIGNTVVMILGNNKYTVAIDSYTPPGPTGSINSGGIGAHATVTVESVLQTPEPSTLVLASLGLPCVAMQLRKRRKRGCRR